MPPQRGGVRLRSCAAQRVGSSIAPHDAARRRWAVSAPRRPAEAAHLAGRCAPRNVDEVPASRIEERRALVAAYVIGPRRCVGKHVARGPTRSFEARIDRRRLKQLAHHLPCVRGELPAGDQRDRLVPFASPWPRWGWSNKQRRRSEHKPETALPFCGHSGHGAGNNTGNMIREPRVTKSRVMNRESRRTCDVGSPYARDCLLDARTPGE